MRHETSLEGVCGGVEGVGRCHVFLSDTGGVEEQAYSLFQVSSSVGTQRSTHLTGLAVVTVSHCSLRTFLLSKLKFGVGAAKIHSRSSPDCRTDGRQNFGRHHMSHIARSGQEPHTPGRTGDSLVFGSGTWLGQFRSGRLGDAVRWVRATRDGLIGLPSLGTHRRHLRLVWRSPRFMSSTLR